MTRGNETGIGRGRLAAHHRVTMLASVFRTTTSVVCSARMFARAGVVIMLVVASVAGAPVLAGAQNGAPYPDTDPDAYYSLPVRTLAAEGVFAGTECSDGFCPDDPIDRTTMAVWTVRVLDGADPQPVSSTRFGDVEASHPYAAFIERFADLGVTQGCRDGTVYCPDDAVVRAEMAVFLSRAYDLAEGPDPGFRDVPSDAWYALDVAKLAASGITSGCGDGTAFCPERPTTRGQMATFLYRAENPESAGTGDSAAFSAVSAGDSHSCALLTDGTIQCRPNHEGDNEYGQADAPTGAFSAVSAGQWHSCGLLADRTIQCWGNNQDGQANAAAGSSFSAVSAGGRHTCGLRTDRTIQCWGNNQDGQANAPTGSSFSAVSVGQWHSCGLLTDGTIQCWGNNQDNSEDGQANAPAGSFSAVSAGGRHTCGLRTDRTIQCWGNNQDGQANAPAGSFSAVSAGQWHSCGLRTSRAIECWGYNDLGQTDVPAGSFSAVSAGGRHTCGLHTNGTIQCWGDERGGEAG